MKACIEYVSIKENLGSRVSAHLKKDTDSFFGVQIALELRVFGEDIDPLLAHLKPGLVLTEFGIGDASTKDTKVTFQASGPQTLS